MNDQFEQFPLWLFLGTHGYSDNSEIVSVAWFQRGNKIISVRRKADDTLVATEVMDLPV